MAATNDPDLILSATEDNFHTRLNQCRLDINNLFDELRAQLNDRENELLEELDRIRVRHNDSIKITENCETLKNEQQAIFESLEKMGYQIPEMHDALARAVHEAEIIYNDSKSKMEEISNFSFQFNIAELTKNINHIGVLDTTINVVSSPPAWEDNLQQINNEIENQEYKGNNIQENQKTKIGKPRKANYLNKTKVGASCIVCTSLVALVILAIGMAITIESACNNSDQLVYGIITLFLAVGIFVFCNTFFAISCYFYSIQYKRRVALDLSQTSGSQPKSKPELDITRNVSRGGVEGVLANQNEDIIAYEIESGTLQTNNEELVIPMNGEQ